jgi:hypothetical protein
MDANELAPGLEFDGDPMPAGHIPVDAIVIVKTVHPDSRRPQWFFRWTEGISSIDALGAGEALAAIQRAALVRGNE